MADFRGQEPLGYIRLGWGEAPYFVAEETEYWHAGKLYPLGDEETVRLFIQHLARQNEAEEADVAVGPAFKFDDDEGRPLPGRPTLVREIGHVGLYYAVGNVTDDGLTKRAAYERNGNRWDGVPQVALVKVRFPQAK